jgi:hypothetical protein
MGDPFSFSGETPNFIRLVSPGQRDERRHGQTYSVLGAKLGRDGMTAGLCFAAGMTARSSGEG